MNVSKLFAKWEEDYKFIKQNAKGIYLNPFISDLINARTCHTLMWDARDKYFSLMFS